MRREPLLAARCLGLFSQVNRMNSSVLFRILCRLTWLDRLALGGGIAGIDFGRLAGIHHLRRQRCLNDFGSCWPVHGWRQANTGLFRNDRWGFRVGNYCQRFRSRRQGRSGRGSDGVQRDGRPLRLNRGSQAFDRGQNMHRLRHRLLNRLRPRPAHIGQMKQNGQLAARRAGRSSTRATIRNFVHVGHPFPAISIRAPARTGHGGRTAPPISVPVLTILKTGQTLRPQSPVLATSQSALVTPRRWRKPALHPPIERIAAKPVL